MKLIDDKELDKICGGDNINGSFINAVANIIDMIRNAGYSIGSGIRRVCEGELCSLE